MEKKKLNVKIGTACMLAYIVVFWSIVAYLLSFLFSACASPKIIERHYHEQQTDTAALVAIVNNRVQQLNARVDSAVSQFSNLTTEQQAQQQQERERVTETITCWVDSLGREVRQEQRVSERDVTTQQQLWRQQLQQQMQRQLTAQLQAHDSLWNARLEALEAHSHQTDSSSYTKQPTGTMQTLRQRLSDTLFWVLLIGVAGLVVFVTWPKFVKWLRRCGP